MNATTESPESRNQTHNAARFDNAIAIASGKGGVGKTCVAVTLAHALARRGRRVLLFDGDLGLANVDIQLGLVPRFSLSDVIQGTVDLAGAVQTYPKGGFDLVAGQSGSGGLTGLTSAQSGRLFASLAAVAKGYDHVVIDLASSIEPPVLDLAQRCPSVVVLTTEEPTALTDAYAFIKMMDRLARHNGMAIAINQAHSQKEGERTYETLLRACQNFLKLTPDLAAIIRTDRAVRDAVRNQIPLLIRAPQSDAAFAIEEFAARIAADPAPDQSPGSTPDQKPGQTSSETLARTTAGT
ncbi:MinD/ParA family protein [Fodinicurvata sp. EGI_FJ10296]|uniref:MinD/ParA family protein n=1 Tax=Fodinicurvata sp. EGI_FJ10296 TaxID=3231908 RepID=UPI0034557C03